MQIREEEDENYHHNQETYHTADEEEEEDSLEEEEEVQDRLDHPSSPLAIIHGSIVEKVEEEMAGDEEEQSIEEEEDQEHDLTIRPRANENSSLGAIPRRPFSQRRQTLSETGQVLDSDSGSSFSKKSVSFEKQANPKATATNRPPTVAPPLRRSTRISGTRAIAKPHLIIGNPSSLINEDYLISGGEPQHVSPQLPFSREMRESITSSKPTKQMESTKSTKTIKISKTPKSTQSTKFVDSRDPTKE